MSCHPTPALYFSLLLTVLLSLSALPQTLSDDIDLLHSRLFTALSPSNASIPSVVSLTRTYQSHLNSSCYFTDVDYFDKSRDVWATSDHMARLLTMTEAFTAPASPLLNDSTLSTQIHCGLAVWFSHNFTNPNWWWGVIGIPVDTTSMLVLLTTDRLSASEVESMKRISYQANWWTDDWGGGANLVWEISVQLYRGVSTRNATAITQGFDRMWKDVVVQPLSLEGVQPDFSYHFHGLQIQQGAYGAEWTSYILTFALNAQGTAFALNATQTALFARFILEGNAWLSIGGTWDFGTIGRSVDRPGSGGPHLGYSSEDIRQLAGLVEEYAGGLRAYADRMDGVVGAAPLVGNRHLYTSDFHVHRRPQYIVTLRTHSTRTVGTECDNFENLKGEHLADGVLNVYASDAQVTRGDEYENIFPLLDWHLINGVTAEVDTPILYCGPETGDVFKVRSTSFVGGVSDGEFGGVTMDTATHNLTGHRSWFFLPDVVVAVASDLTEVTEAEVRTTLHSRIVGKSQTLTVGWRNGSVTKMADGAYSWGVGQVQWLHAGGVGYVVEGEVVVGADIGQKEGNFISIGPNNQTVSKRTVTSWISHGKGRFRNQTSQYSVLPNVTAEQMRAAVQRLQAEVACVINAPLLHGLAVPSMRRAWLVVYPGLNGTFACDNASGGWNLTMAASAGLYLFEETDSNFTVTASIPYVGVSRAAQVRVNRRGSGAGCTSMGGETMVSIPWATGQLLGKSVQVTCAKGRVNNERGSALLRHVRRRTTVE